ncbi:hypothetical protein Tco_0460030 [Tanacetum coccineum]
MIRAKMKGSLTLRITQQTQLAKRIKREQASNLAVQKEQEEQAAQSFTPFWNFPIINDDDDDEYTIQYREYLENSSNAITPDLSTEEPDNSLSMGDKHLSTIPETESNEVTKSSVEDLVLIPMLMILLRTSITLRHHHSKLVSLEEEKNDILQEKLLDINLLIACDSPSSDNFSPISIFEKKSVTFSNPLFDSNDDFASSDNESLFDEDVLEDNVKIYSNPLFEFDGEYISSDVNPLFDEVLEDIECKDSYDSNSGRCTTHAENSLPEYDSFHFEIESDQGELSRVVMETIDEIDAFLDIDISTNLEDGYHDSEGDIIYLESFLINKTIPNLSPEDCPDFEDSRARCFVHRSLALQSLACLY